jgi:hypothetical protein
MFLSCQKRRTRKAERATTKISSEKLEIVIWQTEIRVTLMVVQITGKQNKMENGAIPLYNGIKKKKEAQLTF